MIKHVLNKCVTFNNELQKPHMLPKIILNPERKRRMK